MTFKDLQKLVQSQCNSKQIILFERLQNKPFWIWDIEQHKLEDIEIILLAIAISAILSVVIAPTAIQKALANKVSPNCTPGVPNCPEDQLKQGALGEFYSKAGRDTYYGGISGHDFGQSVSGNAKSSPNLFGSNTAFYGSGKCPPNSKHPEVCV